MDDYQKGNRLTELIKAALMGPVSEKMDPVGDEDDMDPVGDEDDDVNNDGKVNKTDDYLKNRRKAISQAIKKKDKKVNEVTDKTGSGSDELPLDVKSIKKLFFKINNLKEREELATEVLGLEDDQVSNLSSDKKIKFLTNQLAKARKAGKAKKANESLAKRVMKELKHNPFLTGNINDPEDNDESFLDNME